MDKIEITYQDIAENTGLSESIVTHFLEFYNEKVKLGYANENRCIHIREIFKKYRDKIFAPDVNPGTILY